MHKRTYYIAPSALIKSMPFLVPTYGKLQIILKKSGWSVNNQFLMIFHAPPNNIFPM